METTEEQLECVASPEWIEQQKAEEQALAEDKVRIQAEMELQLSYHRASQTYDARKESLRVASSIKPSYHNIGQQQMPTSAKDLITEAEVIYQFLIKP